jgi:uncharacterized protein (TIGR00369 family)
MEEYQAQPITNESERTFLPNSGPCFVCGENNPAGLQTRLYVQDGKVKAPLRAQPHHCGYENVIHGGVIAALMDECMGWAATRMVGRTCFTGEMKIRYLSPAPADEELYVEAEVVEGGRRIVKAQACLLDNAGKEYARSEGRFVPMTPEQTIEVDNYLIYRGGEERVFDELREELEGGGSPGDDD